MNDQLPPLPDEDTLTIPDSWRRSLHPRRGGAPGPKIKMERAPGKAVQVLIEQTGGVVEALLAGRAGDLDLTEAARGHLDGVPDPAGSAAIAAVTQMGTRGADNKEGVYRAFIDSWVTDHGIVFAACALVELSRTEATRKGGGDWLGTWVGAVRREQGDLAKVSQEDARRVRALLAIADDAEYRKAEESLAGLRDTVVRRWLVSYLVPTRQDWVEECCAEPLDRNVSRAYRWLLYCSLGKGDQLTTPSGEVDFHWGDCSRGLLATMADGLGPDVLPAFVGNLGQYVESEDRKRLFETIALLPTDEAFQALMDGLGSKVYGKHARSALLAAMKRFPVRAVRLLAAAALDSAEAASLLKEHLAAGAELVRAVLPELPGEVRALVEPMVASSARVAVAPPETLPALLAEPPWERSSRPVVDGLTPPAGPGMSWREGEREEWLGSDVKPFEKPENPDWAALAEEHRTGVQKTGDVEFMVHGPEELVRPLLAGWKGRAGWGLGGWARLIIAKYELDALPPVLRMVKADPGLCGRQLMPYLHADPALLVSDLLGRSGTGGAYTAREWLDRHGLAAVPLLVPAALGTSARSRRAAERALRRLMDRHDLADMVAAARAAHGDEAASALDALLSADPVETGLVQPSKIGDWVDPAALPQVLLRGRDRALPVDATRRLIALLTLPDPYGMDVIHEACDLESLAEFGWALFKRWRESGAPAKDGWALTQLGRIGDDETVRRLTPIIRAWPGEGGHKNAVNGLGVLAAIGTDVALMHLHGIAQKVKFKGLQYEAQIRIRQVADRLGLSTEQLADRLVPDFGLDADGSMVLDYGPRRFVVGFDEALKPYVTDEDGKLRKALPKPGAKDDAERAPAAYKTFAGLKKDVRTIAADQIRRLETAMVTGRRWTPGEFRDHLVNHPLVWHIARRLVWVSEDGGTVTMFRIAEDRTFADVEDGAFVLPDSARVGIVHPVRLGDALRAWSEMFADYEIVQPFPQLARTVYALSERERDSERLERFEDLKVPFGTVLGLVRRGWDRGEPQDNGDERWISRKVAGDRHVVIELDPGFSVGAVGAAGDHQTLSHVWLATEPGDYRYRPGTDTRLRFGELDPAIASEILADLTTLADAAV